MSSERRTDVVVIGGGPSGLSAATALRRQGVDRVLVVEREREAGGIPRHSDHLGYGIRDRRRFISGPVYARRLVTETADAGAEILTGTMATSWRDERSLYLTSPRGREIVSAEAIVVATGARERPRSARMIPGSRPAGVYTTGELQNRVHLHHGAVGKRAVIVGGELVSWSAAMTLKEAGCVPAAMVTHYDSPESYGVFNLGGRLLFRPDLVTGHRVTQVLGRRRVEGVEVEDLATGDRRVLDCDTVVFTGDWIPDHELVRSAGIELAPDTKGPLVDAAGRTRREGVFAAGNVVHPVDTADIAALGGTHVADAVLRYLGGTTAGAGGVRLLGDASFRWVSPGLIDLSAGIPARGRIETWVNDLVRVPRVTVTQGDSVVTRRRLPWPASPGRVFRIPWDVLNGIVPNGGDVRLHLS
ncbi:NAD(P)/FAD-dependent oxidoreductase [Aeromicrobium piscarium]|uniref:FAD-dependent oxidoreductase n=1 Tax=Aeromicrobium piscarium TaxID=2590901 RepID=A0A554SNX8_9ACTN|nr:FAD-dependent oxidoreductase [Aeromicrobium piscarium]TSD68065.1 FAD-dependent oxidoreductase [Aeromicrobium piscarium]